MRKERLKLAAAALLATGVAACGSTEAKTEVKTPSLLLASDKHCKKNPEDSISFDRVTIEAVDCTPTFGKKKMVVLFVLNDENGKPGEIVRDRIDFPPYQFNQAYVEVWDIPPDFSRTEEYEYMLRDNGHLTARTLPQIPAP